MENYCSDRQCDPKESPLPQKKLLIFLKQETNSTLIPESPLPEVVGWSTFRYKEAVHWWDRQLVVKGWITAPNAHLNLEQMPIFVEPHPLVGAVESWWRHIYQLCKRWYWPQARNCQNILIGCHTVELSWICYIQRLKTHVCRPRPWRFFFTIIDKLFTRIHWNVKMSISIEIGYVVRIPLTPYSFYHSFATFYKSSGV